MTAENEVDVDWLAFQYIADELTDDDRTTFEQRLANDDQACEAVARAVKVTQTLVAANTVDHLAETVLVTTAQRAAWWRRASLVAMVTTACLALVLVYQGVKLHSARTADDGESVVVASVLNDPASQRLAIAWLETRTELPESGLWSSESSEEQPLPDYPLESAGAEEVPPEITAPSWMLAAVSGLIDNPNHSFDAPYEEME
jgi:hypothetical protein